MNCTQTSLFCVVFRQWPFFLFCPFGLSAKHGALAVSSMEICNVEEKDSE